MIRFIIFSNVCSIFLHVLFVFRTMNLCSGRLRRYVTVVRTHSDCKWGSQQVVYVIRASTRLHISIVKISLPIDLGSPMFDIPFKNGLHTFPHRCSYFQWDGICSDHKARTIFMGLSELFMGNMSRYLCRGYAVVIPCLFRDYVDHPDSYFSYATVGTAHWYVKHSKFILRLILFCLLIVHLYITCQ